MSDGDLLADGTSTSNGELALGKNLLVAYMPWEGYNYEDAIILNERLVRDDVLTSIHVKEYEIDARDTKLGRRRDHPGHPEPARRHPGGPRRPRHRAHRRRGRARRHPRGQGHARRARPSRAPRSDCCARSSARRRARCATPRLKVPHGESGKVIDVKVYSRDEDHEMQPGVNQLVKVYVAQKRKISEGDKLAGRHGNKGVISKILPEEDMPFMSDGTPVDIILSPLGVPSRMNVGQVLESPPRLRRAPRLGRHRGQLDRRYVGPRRPGRRRHASVPQDPSAHRAGRLRRDAVLRRRALGRDRAGQGQADDPADLRDARTSTVKTASACSPGTTTARSRCTTVAPARPTTARSRSATRTS